MCCSPVKSAILAAFSLIQSTVSVSSVVRKQETRSNVEIATEPIIRKAGLAMQMPPVEPSRCPAGSEVFTLPAKHEETGFKTFSRVQLAAFQSSGDELLAHILMHIAKDNHMGSPFCAIGYATAQKKDSCVQRVSSAGNDYCSCDWTENDGVRISKSHYPSEELLHPGNHRTEWSGGGLADSPKRNLTMTFDKLVQFVRHPVAVVHSVTTRGGTFPTDVSPEGWAETLRCWAHWWQRVKSNMKPEDVYVLNFEKLCTDTAKETHKLLQFMGGRYAEITLDSVRKAIESDEKLKCFHAPTLETEVHEMKEQAEEWFRGWEHSDFEALGADFKYGENWARTAQSAQDTTMVHYDEQWYWDGQWDSYE